MAAALALVLPSRLTYAGPAQVLPAVIDADGRLGLCDILPGNPPPGPSGADWSGIPWAQMAYNAGARINRWEFRWDKEEPANGTWNFADPDTAVNASLKSGVQIEGILIGTPGWAAAPGQKPGNGLPKGLYLPYTDPGNLWADYVRQTVTHYQVEIRTWEIWNEPDLPFFWSSRPQDYAQLLKVAYLTIRDIDPTETVILGGMVQPDLGFMGRVLDTVNADPQAKDQHGYFDAAAWHAYGPASGLYSNVRRLKSLLVSKGFGAYDYPIWVTEDGFPNSNPNGEPRQAAYVLQTIAYAFAAGAAKVLVYRASDDSDRHLWGLIAANGSPRLGYVAFQVAAQYLARTDATSYAPLPEGERFAMFQPHQLVQMIWNRGVHDGAVDVPADQPGATLVDWQGSVSHLSQHAGSFHIKLPGAGYNNGIDPLGAVVGGPPVLLITDNATAARPANRSFVPPLFGASRRLALLNPGRTAAIAQVAPLAHPKQMVGLSIPARAMRIVDLDLLAGNRFAGLYSIASSASVVGAAVSSGGATSTAVPSTTWYLATAPNRINLANPGTQPAQVDILAFGEKGVRRVHVSVRVRPSSRLAWHLPPQPSGAKLSLVLNSSAPLVVSGPTGNDLQAVAQPEATWYSVQSRKSGLQIFNPNPHESHIQLRIVGPHGQESRQLSIQGHHSASIPSRANSSVIVAASDGVAVSSQNTRSPARPTAEARSDAAFVAAGRLTHMSLFNPTEQTVRVGVALVGTGGTTHRTVDVPALGTESIKLRSGGGPAMGVLINAAVPVVAAPTG